QLARWSLKATSQMVTVSRASLEQLRSKGVPSERVKVIHNAVPTGYGIEVQDSSQIDALRSSLGIPGGQKVILSIGRLSKEKDQVSLVEAMAELRGSFTPSLVILGEGPENKTIVEKPRLLGLTDKVILTGQQ